MGEWAVAQQRLIGISQDHSFGVGVALDLLAELLGLLDPPAHGLSRGDDELVELHGHAALAALHPLDHRLMARR